MSAQPLQAFAFRDMRVDDIDAIMEIELQAYPYPWTAGIFSDCLEVGYTGRVLEDVGENVVGYAMMSIAVDEAHVLNVCVSPKQGRQGLGQLIMEDLMDTAIGLGAQAMFLEVRPSNKPARRLYKRLGFQRIGNRSGYYPADQGREDAIVYSLLF